MRTQLVYLHLYTKKYLRTRWRLDPKV
jgi:hypothetical protein